MRSATTLKQTCVSGFRKGGPRRGDRGRWGVISKKEKQFPPLPPLLAVTLWHFLAVLKRINVRSATILKQSRVRGRGIQREPTTRGGGTNGKSYSHEGNQIPLLPPFLAVTNNYTSEVLSQFKKLAFQALCNYRVIKHEACVTCVFYFEQIILKLLCVILKLLCYQRKKCISP